MKASLGSVACWAEQICLEHNEEAISRYFKTRKTFKVLLNETEECGFEGKIFFK